VQPFVSGTGKHTLETVACMEKPTSALIPTFAALRFTTGLVAWLVPNTTANLLGLGSDHQQPLPTQLFEPRELTLALAITDSASPQLRTRALQLGLLADTLDMIAALRGNAAAGCRRAVRSSREGARRYSLGEDLRRWAVLVSCDELLPSAGQPYGVRPEPSQTHLRPARPAAGKRFSSALTGFAEPLADNAPPRPRGRPSGEIRGLPVRSLIKRVWQRARRQGVVPHAVRHRTQHVPRADRTAAWK
jgi:hypothetical protein